MKLHMWVMKAGFATLALAAMLMTLGCGQQRSADEKTSDAMNGGDAPKAITAKEKKIEAARAKLPPEDRTLVEAQDYCAVQPKQKLGSMGVPLKLTIKGQPVFLCCKACKAKAEDEPDATLKAVEDLKATSKKK